MSEIIIRLLQEEDDLSHQKIADELSEMGAEGVDIVLDQLNKGGNIRLLMLTLSRMTAKKKCREHLIERWGKEGFGEILSYSEDSDPKVRRSAYIIMGGIDAEIIRNSLMKSLNAEKTLYVIPSIILALGNLNVDKEIIQSRIEGLRKEYGGTGENSKHLNEIIRAAEKVLDRLTVRTEKHKFVKFEKAVPILLIPMEQHPEITLEEARKEFKTARLSDGRIEIMADSMEKVFKIRTFYEALISPVRLRDIEYNPALIANCLIKEIDIDMLNLWHEGKPPYKYRIEIKGIKGDRSREAEGLIREIRKEYGEDLINSPSDYEFEIRIERKKERCSVYLKLFTFEDRRFAYRINSLPASIKGETAANCMKLVSAHFRDNARILDPFMGAGTMLIERAFYGKSVRLEGTDIYGEAVKFAKENIRRAGLEAKLYKSDIIEFKNRDKYDEIISNMPYGLRVGTHRENEQQYKDFILRIPELLKPDGVLFLLTADFGLLKRLAKDNGLKLVAEFVIGSGGLLPHLLAFRCPDGQRKCMYLSF